LLAREQILLPAGTPRGGGNTAIVPALHCNPNLLISQKFNEDQFWRIINFRFCDSLWIGQFCIQDGRIVLSFTTAHSNEEKSGDWQMDSGDLVNLLSPFANLQIFLRSNGQ